MFWSLMELVMDTGAPTLPSELNISSQESGTRNSENQSSQKTEMN